MRIDFEAAWKSGLAGGVMVGVLVLTQMVIYSKFLLPAYVLLGTFIYLIALRQLKAIREDDLNLIRRYLGPKFGFAATVLNAILAPK